MTTILVSTKGIRMVGSRVGMLVKNGCSFCSKNLLCVISSSAATLVVSNSGFWTLLFESSHKIIPTTCCSWFGMLWLWMERVPDPFFFENLWEVNGCGWPGYLERLMVIPFVHRSNPKISTAGLSLHFFCPLLQVWSEIGPNKRNNRRKRKTVFEQHLM